MSRHRTSWRGKTALALLVLGAVSVGAALAGAPAKATAGTDPAARARGILAETGARGGLAVVLGAGESELAAALRQSDAWLVQVLDRDADAVRAARRRLEEKGVYGPVAVERLRGDRLPYVGGIVDLVVEEGSTGIAREEIERVLAPGGVAYRRQGEAVTKLVKPRPAAMDEWTHYLHDATGNAAGRDTLVGPPRGLQWIGGPRWSRHHDHMSSVSGVVTSGGRVYYVIDEGPRASIQLPPKWRLVARDAFNGKVLWKKPIVKWFPHIWPLKSGPTQLPRRLVASGDRLWATLGIDAPLSQLDGRSGEVVRAFEGTRATEEVLLSGGVLFLLVNETPRSDADYRPAAMVCWEETGRVARERPWNERPRKIVALRADTAERIWERERTVVPLTLAADEERVCFHDGERIVALRRGSGEEEWRSPPVGRRKSTPLSFGPTLVLWKDVVLFSGGDRKESGLSAKTGALLWSAKHPRSGHHSAEDLLVVDGLVWSGATAGGRDSGVFTGRDPRTGEVVRQFPPDVKTYWFHQRCYRSKATGNFLLVPRTGTEFVDVRAKHWEIHHWVRGACVYGVMPANGLLYSPPHPCACYLESKLDSFTATRARSALPRQVSDEGRLERGPAWGKPLGKGEVTDDDWPTYRHDAARSGSTRSIVPERLASAWERALGGRLSSVVVAGGRLFVAAVDRHALFALDAETGKTLWSRTAGGRIDSPPTVDGGRVIFGSADGTVRALRARDGELVWSFRAAPADRRLVAYEQVESVWPVSGSVLVRDGVVWCVAGRSMFLDGGLRLLRLDAAGGRKLSETHLDDRTPDGSANLQRETRNLNLPVALPDILSSIGERVYMRSQPFDLEGKRRGLGPETLDNTERATLQEGDGAHLFCPSGFLDDSWWHRTYWLFGRTFSSGCNWWFRAGRYAPAGRILVFDDDTVYGYGRRPELFVWTHVLEYHLFAARRSVRPEAVRRALAGNRQRERKVRRAIFDRSATRSAAREDLSAVDWKWSVGDLPLQVRAMLLAGDRLVIAGPPDVVDEEEIYRKRFDPAVEEKAREQAAALRGERGAKLRVVSARDGKTLSELSLDTLPVWDGMAAARGRVYLSTKDGRVISFEKG